MLSEAKRKGLVLARHAYGLMTQWPGPHHTSNQLIDARRALDTEEW